METGITIFTPTYNRIYLLNRLYESIRNLNYTNFEWVIVDDGSTDGTENLINRFRENANFKLVYEKQENQGKYIAINNGVKLADKELFFIVDSDDWLPENSLNKIDDYYQKIKLDERFAGVAGLKKVANENIENIVLHQNEFVSNSLDFRFLYNYSGDIAEVFRTSILKMFPFPKFKNEKYCKPSLIWNRIAVKYNLLYFNEYIYHSEYQEGGITSQYSNLMLKNPKSSLKFYQELFSFYSFKNNLELKIKFLKHYIDIARNNNYSWIYILKSLKLKNLWLYFWYKK
ncbi:MAG: glycosyltransferase family 2 protein [Weeksellaceae bacterium]